MLPSTRIGAAPHWIISPILDSPVDFRPFQFPFFHTRQIQVFSFGTYFSHFPIGPLQCFRSFVSWSLQFWLASFLVMAFYISTKSQRPRDAMLKKIALILNASRACLTFSASIRKIKTWMTNSIRFWMTGCTCEPWCTAFQLNFWETLTTGSCCQQDIFLRTLIDCPSVQRFRGLQFSQ